MFPGVHERQLEMSTSGKLTCLAGKSPFSVGKTSSDGPLGPNATVGIPECNVTLFVLAHSFQNYLLSDQVIYICPGMSGWFIESC